MTRKTISTQAPAVSCDVCGRTLLRGEHADVFLHGGTRRSVCELCTARAAHEGWIREGLDDATVRARRSGRPGRGLLSRLRDRRPAPDPGEPGDEPQQAPSGDAVPEPYAPEARTVHAVPTNADLKVQRALDLFNASRHPRTVAGVARSLGAPLVSVRPSATEGSVVGIVVAWELSWYRYEVDLADEGQGVRVASQGYELSELAEAEQTPNAAAVDDGTLHLAVQHA